MDLLPPLIVLMVLIYFGLYWEPKASPYIEIDKDALEEAFRRLFR